MSELMGCGHIQQKYKKNPYKNKDAKYYANYLDTYSKAFNVCRKCAFKILFGDKK